MNEREIHFIRKWTENYKVGEVFTFEGWDDAHEGIAGAPAGVSFSRLVKLIKGQDQRVNFIELGSGLGTDGKESAKKANNARYYRRAR
ncbi:hypothetical protein [Falsiruegeria mediterranea]